MIRAVSSPMIKINIEPESVFESFPTDFLGEGGKPETGFAEKILSVPIPRNKEIIFEVSYDGELELIAIVKEAPPDLSKEEAKKYFLSFLDIDDDDEEEEKDDEEDDEEEEDEKQPA